MVSPSVPLYPDWHHGQQRNQVQGGVLRSSSDDQHPHNQFLSPPAAMPPGSGNMGLGSRPGSMAERARMANLQQPQAALKCPRCDSNNTKFCYFNNYSLSQPRHFCKTCRRYWTRGGAMRNVPVGGGCRRNKRSKSRSSRSKSPAPTRSTPAPVEAPDILSHLPPFPQPPFLPPSALHHFGEFGDNELGLNFGSMMMSAASDAGGGVLSGLAEQWRMQQQFPLLTGLDPPVSSGLFHSIGQGEQCVEPSFCGGASHVRVRQGVEPGMTNQVAGAVKLEEQNHNHSHLYHKGGEGLMMTSTPSRNISGINMNHHQYGWAGDDQNASNAWPHDLSPGFTSSFSSTTTSHLL